MPLVDVLELGLVGAENLDLLAAFVQLVAHGCVNCRRVLFERRAVGRRALHLLRAAHQCGDVHAGGRQRQQAHGREDRETAAHVVGDDEGGVSLVCGEGLQCAARLVGDGNDTRGGILLAVTLLDLGLDDAECYGGLGRGTRLRDDDGGDRIVLHGVEQLVGVILRDVLSGEEYRRVLMLAAQELERVAVDLGRVGLRATDGKTCLVVVLVDDDLLDGADLGAELLGLRLDGGDLCVVYRRGEVYPSQKIAARTLARMEQFVRLLRLSLHLLGDDDSRLGDVQFD